MPTTIRRNQIRTIHLISFTVPGCGFRNITGTKLPPPPPAKRPLGSLRPGSCVGEPAPHAPLTIAEKGGLLRTQLGKGGEGTPRPATVSSRREAPSAGNTARGRGQEGSHSAVPTGNGPRPPTSPRSLRHRLSQ